jgi:hypothetical protein
VLPPINLSGSYLTVVVAVFGTTISPYLFFWQAGEEVEDEQEDPKAEPLIEAPKQAPRQMARMRLDTIARRINASGDGGLSSRPIAGGDFYAHWRPPADMSGSTPQVRGRKAFN